MLILSRVNKQFGVRSSELRGKTVVIHAGVRPFVQLSCAEVSSVARQRVVLKDTASHMGVPPIAVARFSRVATVEGEVIAEVGVRSLPFNFDYYY